MSLPDFRQFVPAPGQSRIAAAGAREHAQARLATSRAKELFSTWESLFHEPYRGVTPDGVLQHGLFQLQPNGAPALAMRVAAGALLQSLTPAQRQRAVFPVDSELWRRWQNTELLVEEHGLRLDEIDVPLRDAVMRLLRLSLSERGLERVVRVMQFNAFLG